MRGALPNTDQARIPRSDYCVTIVSGRPPVASQAILEPRV